ncbi:low-density lipoprotein receptor YWTD repeat-containing protein [Tsukamurella paurometabola]|uniref:Low-density lipoprotein receptor YWTD repeat protein n=1 Tax=Tsukamurella paurometabola (strain ATCC 8368 / DSM 20162 / CCUG 35730 / CIP 100753 / JCM 10117 / KCTC 9821 / NBRC 16120 / NCIMB 702349 / NCTC 13040) TaxID=521096 RepID=D5UQ63_TSUPD|nr:low-density lipoprotein receptor YWTD repeat-containing protein [Tsukamurella paurometabola]ADG78833.1 low-density lipoprotein receptor YWTD repeat protein [Tsukamurella paurometabola DSM 20162]SUP33275.1 CAS/CSE protein involved in chromosome segregation [Tsukamurella paurometabola]
MTDAKLYVLQIRPRAEIIELAPDGSGVRTVADVTGYFPDGIVVDESTSSILWTHMGTPTDVPKGEFFEMDGAIFRTSAQGSTEPLIGWGQIVTPKQLTGDFERGHLYWGDREGMRLMRSGLDGANVTVLVRTGVFPRDSADAALHCVGVTVDHRNDRVFWTQKGAPDSGTGRIFTAGIDLPTGATPDDRGDITVVAADLPEPIDLEYDDAENALYWTDRGDLPEGNSLNRIRFDGATAGPKEVLATGLQEGIGLALDREGRRAFVSDLAGNILAVNLDGAHDARVIAKLGMLTGIAYAAAVR